MDALRGFWARIRAFLRDVTGDDDTSGAPTTGAKPCETCGDANGPGQLVRFHGRRRFLHRLSLTLGGIASALVAIPFLGFLFAARRDAPETAWRVIGAREDFPIGETVRVTFLDPAPLPWAGFSARTAAWVRQDEDGQFLALSVYCTHVGCPIRWLEDARLFMCPCHGGSFFADGAVAGGPPRHALDRYSIRVRDGQVEILAQPQPLPT